jgi:hypothetical protein
MPDSHVASAARLPRFGALVGVLTGGLGGGMVWTTSVTPSLPTALTIATAIVLLAALGWFGTERVLALTSQLEGVSE